MLAVSYTSVWTSSRMQGEWIGSAKTQCAAREKCGPITQNPFIDLFMYRFKQCLCLLPCLRLHVVRGPARSRSLQEKLGLSQPTLGGEVVRIGAARSIQYLLRDRNRGVADLPVYRVDADGLARDAGPGA